MIYREETRDLFSVPDSYYLAHCISADFALGAGIATEFNKRFDMRKKPTEYAFSCLGQSNFEQMYIHTQQAKCIYGLQNGCVLIDRVFNLITKKRFYHKPTYESINHALNMMRLICEDNNINKIAMPLIGCGLDNLRWSEVSKIVKDVFQDTDVEILVCRQ